MKRRKIGKDKGGRSKKEARKKGGKEQKIGQDKGGRKKKEGRKRTKDRR